MASKTCSTQKSDIQTEDLNLHSQECLEEARNLPICLSTYHTTSLAGGPGGSTTGNDTSVNAYVDVDDDQAA